MQRSTTSRPSRRQERVDVGQRRPVDRKRPLPRGPSPRRRRRPPPPRRAPAGSDTPRGAGGRSRSRRRRPGAALPSVSAGGGPDAAAPGVRGRPRRRRSRRTAFAWASSASRHARKQWTWDIAVSVRSTMSATSWRPYGRSPEAASTCRALFPSTRNRWLAPGRPAMSTYFLQLDVAVGAQDDEATVPPGAEAVRREPVDARVPGAPVAAQDDIPEVLELRPLGTIPVGHLDRHHLGLGRPGHEQELVHLVRGDVARGCRRTARARKNHAGRVGRVETVRPEPHRLDDLADGAGLRPAPPPARSPRSRSAR